MDFPPPSHPFLSHEFMSFLPRLAKPRQDSIMSGEGETVGGASSSRGCWLNSPSFPPLTS